MPRDPGFYSRIVALMKIGAPLLGAFLLLALFLAPQRDDSGIGLQFSRADLEAMGEGLRIENPRIAGMTRDGEEFVFAAGWVLPDGPSPRELLLGAFTGRIGLPTGVDVELVAKTARLDLASEMLTLEENVQVSTSDNYIAKADRVEADVKSGDVTGMGNVRAEGPEGHVEAERFFLSSSDKEGRTLRFVGGVVLRYSFAETDETTSEQK